MNRFMRRLAAIAWPAFLGAAALQMGVFAFVDPASLHLRGGASLALSATTIYSLAFVAFWVCCAGACALAVLLERSADDLNAPGNEAPRKQA
jgi:cytosine/uracil/thiamine/allantoin permease